MFMNEEKIRFKDLPRADAHTILDAFLDGQCELWFDGEWQPRLLARVISMNEVYRVKPKPMQVPWEQLEDWIQWVAIDSERNARGYKKKPVSGNMCWMPSMIEIQGAYTKPSMYCDLNGVKIIKGDAPWYEQIQKRPTK